MAAAAEAYRRLLSGGGSGQMNLAAVRAPAEPVAGGPVIAVPLACKYALEEL